MIPINFFIQYPKNTDKVYLDQDGLELPHSYRPSQHIETANYKGYCDAVKELERRLYLWGLRHPDRMLMTVGIERAD
jgi:hypothetical protein